MNIVWIFREMRSGSTALTSHIAHHLNRPQCILKPLPKHKYVFQIPDPEKYVFSTHSFLLLNKMKSYKKKPILIRSSRKNKLEQVLSRLFLEKVNAGKNPSEHFMNITNRNVNIFDLTEPFEVPLEDVYTCLENLKMDDYYWDTISLFFPNQTVYYEDLCDTGVSIPLLNIPHLKLSTNSFTQKIPDYKKKMFINYDEIVQYVHNYPKAPLAPKVVDEYLKVDNIKLEYFK